MKYLKLILHITALCVQFTGRVSIQPRTRNGCAVGVVILHGREAREWQRLCSRSCIYYVREAQERQRLCSQSGRPGNCRGCQSEWYILCVRPGNGKGCAVGVVYITWQGGQGMAEAVQSELYILCE
ncbi:hypothetical protein XELAEV_18043029mg [Xenopus laevis]|uniref:Secreted protein n=1 Tax=Xenopus laevis TaxID=8355 RepID=A0A974C5A6_XENLA|nr:hypothetical protein XELAEV_18043029mg [Xenopus laevis]